MAQQNTTSSKDEVLKIISSINNKKKRADSKSIFLAANDTNISSEEIESIVEELCNEEKLKIIKRAGKVSYRVCNNNKSKIDEERDEIGKLSSQSDSDSYDDEEENNNNNNKADRGNWFYEEKVENENEKNNFEILEPILNGITDLKEYINFEMNRPKATQSNEILTYLKEENSFLKEELKDTRDLIKNILENININNRRQNQSTETITDFKIYEQNFKNSWKQVPKGKSISREQKTSNNNNIELSNRFNGLSQDKDNVDDSNKDVSDFNNNTDTLSKKNKKRPNPVINLYPERDMSYAKVSNFPKRKKNIKVLCDSIPKGIRGREFSDCIDEGNAHIKSFPGSTVTQLNHYSMPTLWEEKPEIVILHAGINDLLSNNEHKTPDDEIATEIMKIGKNCVVNGVEKVFISGIIYCKHIDGERIDRINKILKEQSLAHNFMFIDNNKINTSHLWKDGIHLRESGKILLAQNFIDSINTFLRRDWRLTDQT